MRGAEHVDGIDAGLDVADPHDLTPRIRRHCGRGTARAAWPLTNSTHVIQHSPWWLPERTGAQAIGLGSTGRVGEI